MSESTPTPADVAAQQQPAEPAQAEQQQPEVEETDWKAEARKWEQRAKENRSAADELARIREAQKTDAERAAEALETARNEAAQARAELLRYRTAAEYGITSAEDIELFLTGTDEETLQRQAKALSERTAATSSPRAPRPDPNQGRPGGAPRSKGDAFAAFAENYFTR